MGRKGEEEVASKGGEIGTKGRVKTGQAFLTFRIVSDLLGGLGLGIPSFSQETFETRQGFQVSGCRWPERSQSYLLAVRAVS